MSLQPNLKNLNILKKNAQNYAVRMKVENQELRKNQLKEGCIEEETDLQSNFSDRSDAPPPFLLIKNKQTEKNYQIS